MGYKKIVILLGVMWMFGTSQAQNIEEQVLDFHIAPLFSRLNSSSDYISPNGINVGLKLGATVNFKFTEWAGFVAGLDFVLWSGGKLLYSEGGNFLPSSSLSDPQYTEGDMPFPDNTSIRYTINYIELPFGMQFNLPEINDVSIFMRIPTITMGVRNRARGTIEAGSLLLEKEKIGKDVSFFNFLWGMALGADFNYRGHDMSGMIFLNSGLADVTRDKGKQVIEVDNQTKVIKEDSKGALNQFGIQIAVKIQ
ncbi:hypothetical protein [Membranihabitans marinus]|uniref:hypothetical protein n=1 Tax=Membranihabitans marinus TaxID=1227546 RepID=UPI001F402A11|nr:hypothetical protein [Membranihabitans marinus]